MIIDIARSTRRNALKGRFDPRALRLRRLTISVRLGGAIGAALVSLAVMGAIAIIASREIQTVGSDLYAESIRFSDLQMRMTLSAERAIDDVNSAQAEADPEQLEVKRGHFRAMI